MVEINVGKMGEINAGEWLYHKGEEEAGHPHTSSPLSHPPQCGPNTVTLNPHTSSQSTIHSQTSPSGFSSKKNLYTFSGWSMAKSAVFSRIFPPKHLKISPIKTICLLLNYDENVAKSFNTFFLKHF